jgi:hypothetical protein
MGNEETNIKILTDLIEYLKENHSNLPSHVFETLGEVINDLKGKDDRSMAKLIESNKRFDEKGKPKKDDRDSYEGGFDSSMWLSTI